MTEPELAPSRRPDDLPPIDVRGKLTWQQLGDGLFWLFTLLAALVLPLLAVLLVVLLVDRSLPAIRHFGWPFLIGTEWSSSGLGALPFIWGTLVTSLVAMVIAAPLGIGAAAYLSEIASGWVRRTASFLIELLAAIPSVIYGWWGYQFLVPIFREVFPWLGVANASGKSCFTAGVLLAVMIVPYITAIAFDVCRAVPTAQREAALSLGATRWQLIASVVLPYARSGITGACFLALGRALGETMAVAMLIGNIEKLSLSPFVPGYSIPAVIANKFPTPNSLQNAALVELGLVLLLVTVVVNGLARLLIWNMTRGGGGLLRRWFRGRQSTRADIALSTPELSGSDTPAPQGAPTREAPLVSSLHNRFAAPMNRIMTLVLGVCLCLTLVPLFHILAFVTWKGVKDLSWSFFTHDLSEPPGGLGHALIGSGIMVALATLAAVPIGILAALFLTEYRRSRLTPAVRFIGEILAGVPSIIVGLFAYALIVMPFHGPSAWAGAFALAVMMVPIVMRSSEEALKLVPATLRNASYALGASHWQTVVRVIIPSALPAVITGVFLAIARIVGETAPLLFAAGGSKYWLRSPNEDTPFLTYYIYNGAVGEGDERLAWAGAVVLLLFVMVLNIGIRLLTGRRVILASRAD